MNIKALKNWGGVTVVFRKGFEGKLSVFRKKQIKFFDIDVLIEKQEYDFWRERGFDDCTNGEHILPLVKKEERRRKFEASEEYKITKQLDAILKKK